MQREIKFRAWDKQNNKMVKVWAINYEGFQGDTIASFFAVNPVINGEYVLRAENAVLMQYTGLKDKNVKDVFEGDICILGEIDYVKYVVKYNRHNARFQLFQSLEGSRGADKLATVGLDFRYTGNTSEGSFTIVGNIYENPTMVF